jgi:predicted nuclease of predicted toxin-antitoxin system
MLILADENFPRRVVEYLRLANHDVVWAGNDFQSSSDNDVLERAETDGRILFTLDRDFWQIAIQRRDRMRKGGVVLIRVHPATVGNVEKLVRMVMTRGDSLVGQAALVTPWGIDTRPAGRNEAGATRE